LDAVAEVEIIAVNKSIRELNRLRTMYGDGRWRTLKGKANIELSNGATKLAELHWYEAHVRGRKEFKIKRFLT